MFVVASLGGLALGFVISVLRYHSPIFALLWVLAAVIGGSALLGQQLRAKTAGRLIDNRFKVLGAVLVAGIGVAVAEYALDRLGEATDLLIGGFDPVTPLLVLVAVTVYLSAWMRAESRSAPKPEAFDYVIAWLRFGR